MGFQFPPRLMAVKAAAHYLGVSEGTLIKLGIPRRELRAKRLYDKVDLDAYADGLPYEDGVDSDAVSCDDLFGPEPW